VVDDEAPSPEQQAIFRSMTPGQRWEAAVQLYWSARRLKTAPYGGGPAAFPVAREPYTG